MKKRAIHMEVEPMGKGFIMDGAIKRTVIGMAKCLLTPGEINLGWNDIRKVLLHNGETVIAFGSGTGKSRATKACDDALSAYKTATRTTKRATRLLFRLTGPENLLLKEVYDARETIERSLCPSAGVTFGVARDSRLSDEVKVILIAAESSSLSKTPN